MGESNQATRIHLFNFSTPPMRAFHMTWFAFFLCFFAWFGIAPLMQIVREELHLTKSQIGWCIIGSVSITIVARLLTGWLCDRFGPRRTYTGVLLFGSLPVIGIALAHDFETFLLFRVLIGAIGASFVVTQYHTSMMFAPNCVGTANAMTAGWGNLGGGVVQLVMPLLFTFFVAVVGLSDSGSWRACMIVAGVVCLLTGIAYFFLTQDLPGGDLRRLRAAGLMPSASKVRGAFREACRDYRVWVLFVIYGACFGIELTLDNIAALYFTDYFGLGLEAAGIAAASFGMMNVFARALGGWLGDRCGRSWGLRGRVWWLFAIIFAEGLSLMLFARMPTVVLAIAVMVVFSLFVQMGCGATYAVVPFVNKRALGSVSGIVGAGGNAGAVAAGFLFKSALSWPTVLLLLGGLVAASAFLTLLVRFAPESESETAKSSPDPRLAVELSPAT
ncbi:MAG TPA: MFS transporter [Tepidisphaeraceae bacterium]|jgi:NNP family nitrate/nitrite transporter-like MFS transporter